MNRWLGLSAIAALFLSPGAAGIANAERSAAPRSKSDVGVAAKSSVNRWQPDPTVWFGSKEAERGDKGAPSDLWSAPWVSRSSSSVTPSSSSKADK